MILSNNLIAWNNMDISKIEEAYDKIAPNIRNKYPDAITRNEVKSLMEEALPDYEIKCDEEINSSKVIDSENLIVRVSTKKLPDGSFNYIDVIF